MSDYDDTVRALKTLGQNRRAMIELRRDLAQATRLLCQVVGEMESDGYTFNYELTTWWNAHKKDKR
jgi:hypothetical protein